jgi:hypothetical protein
VGEGDDDKLAAHDFVRGSRNESSTKSRFSTKSKYYRLHLYFRRANGTSKSLSFAEVEEVLGLPLPPGARSSRAWWGNSRSGHPQSRAWLLAGWRVVHVDVTAEVVKFQRVHT